MGELSSVELDAIRRDIVELGKAARGSSGDRRRR